MKESSFNDWEKGIFSAVKQIGAPNNTDTVRWYLHDRPPDNDLEFDDGSGITYVWNKHGFRSDEFVNDGRDSIMVLGCSFAVGLGVKIEDTWASQLRDKINPDLKVYNLGISATSGDYIVRALHKTIDELKPIAVFVMWPGYGSREILIRKRIITFRIGGPSSAVHVDKFFANYTDVFTDPSYFMYQQNKNVEMAKAICDSRGIGFFDLSVIPKDNIPFDDPNNLVARLKNFSHTDPDSVKVFGSEHKFAPARDGLHFGKEWNGYIASVFHQKYSNQRRH